MATRRRKKVQEEVKVFYRHTELISNNKVRLKVYGGWVVFGRLLNTENYKITGLTSCYVPDPNHLWKLEKFPR